MLRGWARISGALGVIANLFLPLFYALAQPWRSGPKGLVVAFLLVIFVWLALTGSSLVARSIGTGLVVGVLIFGVSFALPKGSAATYAALGVGAGIGLIAWISFPSWLLMGGARAQASNT